MSAEEWRPIPCAPEYQISESGRVVSFYNDTTGRELTGTVPRSGYRYMRLVTNGERVRKPVHQLVCETWHGPRPEGMVVRHLDGNRTNNHHTNLAWGTPLENGQDMVRHGTHRKIRETHCPNGHPYSGDNLMLTNEARRCRTCRRQQSRERHQRRRAERVLSHSTIGVLFRLAYISDEDKAEAEFRELGRRGVAPNVIRAVKAEWAQLRASSVMRLESA